MRYEGASKAARSNNLPSELLIAYSNCKIIKRRNDAPPLATIGGLLLEENTEGAVQRTARASKNLRFTTSQSPEHQLKNRVGVKPKSLEMSIHMTMNLPKRC